MNIGEASAALCKKESEKSQVLEEIEALEVMHDNRTFIL